MQQLLIDRDPEMFTRLERRLARQSRSFPVWLIVGLAIATCIYGCVAHLYVAPPPGAFFSGALTLDNAIYMSAIPGVFDHGDGFVFSMPFTPHASASHCYTDLFLVVLAWLHKFSNISIDYLYQATGAAGCLLVFGAVFFLIKSVEEDRLMRTWMFLLAALSGSVGWIPAGVSAVRNYVMHNPQEPFIPTVLQYLFHGGNSLDSLACAGLVPQQCLSNALLFFAIGYMARGKVAHAVILASLTWWSSPVNGVAASTILGLMVVSNVVRKIMDRSGAWWQESKKLLPILLLTTVGLTYFGLYLPSFPDALNTALLISSTVGNLPFAYYLVHYHIYLVSLVLLPVVCWRRHDREVLFRDDGTFVLISVVAGSLAAMQMNWSLPAMIPQTFAHGCLFVGLAPLTLKLLRIVALNAQRTIPIMVLAIILLVGCVDTGIVLYQSLSAPPSVAWLPANSRDIVDAIRANGDGGLLAGTADSADVQLFLMRETKVACSTPEPFMPWASERTARSQSVVIGNDLPVLQQHKVRYVLATAKELPRLSASPAFAELTPLVQSDPLSLFKVAAPPPPEPPSQSKSKRHSRN